jgi:predicted nucleic acid-binding protein
VSVFVDSSALLALLNAGDRNHHLAAGIWQSLLSDTEDIRTTNYVAVETAATAQRRFGIRAARDFLLDIVPLISVEWVTAPVHELAVTSLVTASRRDLSLVDCVSFEVMRQTGIETAFTFDAHFAEQGFTCLPAPPTGER